MKAGLVLLSLTFLSDPVAAAGSGWSATPGHIARSLTNLLGIGGGLIAIYYAEKLRRKTRGSAFEGSIAWFEVGSMVFMLDFLLQELRHAFGIKLIAGSVGPPPAQFHVFFMMSMAGLSIVMVLYALSFKSLLGAFMETDNQGKGRGVLLSVGVIGGLLVVGVLANLLGSANGGPVAFINNPDDLLHAIVPHVGELFALLLAYYAYTASKEFQGGIIGEASRYVMYGAGLFFVSYVLMELRHVWGINLLTFLPDFQFVLAVYFFLFTPTALIIAYGYYKIGDVFDTGGGDQ